MAKDKKPPKAVNKLITDALKNKKKTEARKAEKKPTLAQRFVPRKGRREQ